MDETALSHSPDNNPRDMGIAHSGISAMNDCWWNMSPKISHFSDFGMGGNPAKCLIIACLLVMLALLLSFDYRRNEEIDLYQSNLFFFYMRCKHALLKRIREINRGQVFHCLLRVKATRLPYSYLWIGGTGGRKKKGKGYSSPCTYFLWKMHLTGHCWEYMPEKMTGLIHKKTIVFLLYSTMRCFAFACLCVMTLDQPHNQKYF